MPGEANCYYSILVRPPQPAKGTGRNYAPMIRIVTTIAYDEAEIIAGFRKGSGDTEVVRKPVPLKPVPSQIAMPDLKEDAARRGILGK